MNNTITSSSGQVANVTVRRSECSDAEAIENLLSPEALELFGPINVLQLLEKANLAVTLASEEGDVMAHASFFDHPVTSLVDPPHWESFFCKHLKADALTVCPWNTLFLHLFVSQTAFSAASFQHIMRCLQCNHTDGGLCIWFLGLQWELHASFLISTNTSMLLYNPSIVSRVKSGNVCVRVEDHDDVMHIVAQQTKILSVLQRPYFLSELIEAQDKNNHAAVCECDGTITGFISVTAEVDVRRLQEHFDLKHFGGLCKAKQDADDTDDSESDADPHPHEAEKPPQEPQPEPQQEPLEEPESEGQQECQVLKQQVIITVDSIIMKTNLTLSLVTVHQDLDFCIITVPTMSLDFPLLQNFLRVPPASSTCRRCACRSVNVRPALESDRDGLADLVRRVRRGRVALLRDLDLLFDNQADAVGTRAHVDGGLTLTRARRPDACLLTQAECPLQAFVADVDGALAGMLIIRDEMDMEYIRARYNIENFIYFSHHGAQEHAQLRHFVLRRCFQHFSRHLFKEALRLARKSSLYHRVYPLGSGREDGCVDHLDFVLDCAVPVRPRRQIIYPLKELGPNAPARSITEEQAPFALNLISRKLTMEPKVTVNARIVLVGASDTGLSFLEVLCFCPHLRFNNLTLISTNGFPADYGPAGIKFLSTSHAYNSREMAQLPLRSCVAEVAAKMVAINRKSKHVVVSSGAKIPYDYLVLCTGLQYQVPCPTQVDQEQPETNEPRKEASFPPRYTGTVPSNFFTLNDPHDCNTARDWLLENFVRKKDNAVVYGNGLDVFTTVEMLLRIGVRGSCIHLVLTPPLRPRGLYFSDAGVESAVMAAMTKAQVHIHHDCLLMQMNNGEHPDPLTSVSFSTGSEALHLPCGVSVFINLSSRGVDYDAFGSINSSFLVFDGRLVIDGAFRTNDAAIWGAGPLTKFSRSYYSDEWSHANFNSKEVGQELATMLLRHFDPTLEAHCEMPSAADRLVPIYKRPKIKGAKLPGRLNYLCVTKPVASRPRGPSVGRRIATGRPESGDYFCLHLDRNQVVETITCLSLKPLPVHNLMCLYGKHQQLLGQLLVRLQLRQIHDLYSFFRQSWCLAIFHDRFSDFEEELLQGDAEVRHLQGAAPRDLMKNPSSRAPLRINAAKYLSFNRNLLPMFTCPDDL
uniref:Cilia and flagella associated protein 61 n=1 Tax=Hippocampus comes TaxID=109280 RepID=A0A3Q2XLS6_HIPCM